MAFGRDRKRTERAKLDATPPWGVKEAAEQPPTTGPFDIRDVADAELSEPEQIDAERTEHEDATDAPSSSAGPRIDFGAIQVPVDLGLELRVEVNDAGDPTAVTLANSDGQMQLGVFAAPRTEGIWDEVRGEIRLSIAQQGGTAEDKDGPFGAELVGRLPQGSGFAPVRFLGVDGPRWFLRAMLIGPAAADRSAGEPFMRAFRRLVIVRGDAPLPVREAVPLVLPKDLAQQIADGGAVPQQPARKRPAGRGPATTNRRR